MITIEDGREQKRRLEEKDQKNIIEPRQKNNKKYLSNLDILPLGYHKEYQGNFKGKQKPEVSNLEGIFLQM
jgi:hypothetical protein